MNFLYIPAQYQLAHTRGIQQCVPAPHATLLKSSATSSLVDITATIMKLAKQGKPVHGIITSDINIVQQYLKKLYGIQVHAKDEATLQNYAGCMFEHEATTPTGTKYKLPVVVIGNPEALMYDSAAVHLATRYISKLYDRSWFTAPALEWELATEDSLPSLYKLVSSPSVILMSVDIETTLQELPHQITEQTHFQGVPLRGMYYTGYARTASGDKSSRMSDLMPIITCVGYTVILKEGNTLRSYTIVIPMKGRVFLNWIRKFNQVAAPKVLQNGRYDCSYFLRYDAPLTNYVFDTYMLMHSYLCELRRGLESISAYCLRNHMYWKDESSGNVYEYNAKDCHATAWSCLVLLQLMPSWAHANYLSVFKQVFPCITCGLEGMREDPTEAHRLWQHYQDELAADREWWDTVVKKHFNVGSAPQVKQLFISALRTGIKDTQRKSLEGIIHKHPLWRLLVERLIKSRENKKADSTYMNVITFDGRILYELDPAGTETGRYASKASSFWCGTQIQNIPGYAKSMFVADRGYELSSIDNAQSESRTTAYIVGDEKLIDAVENAPDFHTRNASLFFGIPEATLFEYKKSANKELNDLYKKYRNKIGKRVNHGANYNMGEDVLITTMTPLGIIEAKHTLKLPGRFTLREVAKYLLDCFDNAYPKVRSKEPGGYHYAVIQEVRDTGMLVTPDGWTRRTFLQPWKSKLDLNALVAFKPQSWSVRCINRAFFDAWHQYQIVENVCRMKAQIHDEILYQTLPENTEYVTAGISKLMARPNKFTKETSGLGVDGEMVIPNDPKTGAFRWSELKD